MRLVNYFTDRGHKIAIVNEKRTKIHAVLMTGSGLKVCKLNKSEGRYMKDIDGLKKAAKQMRKFGKERGSTKQARVLLRGV
ncbi:MAG: hypothetical protein ACYSW0_18400 [Planctomycetota bacterium]|jgi:hypothetical protein